MSENIYKLENHNKLNNVFKYIGEFIIYFNDVQEEIETCTGEYLRIETYASKFSGITLGGTNNLRSFLNEVIAESKCVDSDGKTKALVEAERIIKTFEEINRVRNYITHGMWNEWSEEVSIVYLSLKQKESDFGRTAEYISIEDLKFEIRKTKKIGEDIFNFFQKYQFGEGI